MTADEYVVVTPTPPPAPTVSPGPSLEDSVSPTASPTKGPSKAPTPPPSPCYQSGATIPGGCDANTDCCDNEGCSGGKPAGRTCLGPAPPPAPTNVPTTPGPTPSGVVEEEAIARPIIVVPVEEANARKWVAPGPVVLAADECGCLG